MQQGMRMRLVELERQAESELSPGGQGCGAGIDCPSEVGFPRNCLFSLPGTAVRVITHNWFKAAETNSPTVQEARSQR